MQRNSNINIPFWITIISELDDSPCNPTHLSNKYSITYSHTIKILYKLEKISLVHKEKKGRIATFTLTKLGKELSCHCKHIAYFLNHHDFKE